MSGNPSMATTAEAVPQIIHKTKRQLKQLKWQKQMQQSAGGASGQKQQLQQHSQQPNRPTQQPQQPQQPQPNPMPRQQQQQQQQPAQQPRMNPTMPAQQQPQHQLQPQPLNPPNPQKRKQNGSHPQQQPSQPHSKRHEHHQQHYPAAQAVASNSGQQQQPQQQQHQQANNSIRRNHQQLQHQHKPKGGASASPTFDPLVHSVGCALATHAAQNWPLSIDQILGSVLGLMQQNPQMTWRHLRMAQHDLTHALNVLLPAGAFKVEAFGSAINTLGFVDSDFDLVIQVSDTVLAAATANLPDPVDPKQQQHLKHRKPQPADSSSSSTTATTVATTASTVAPTSTTTATNRPMCNAADEERRTRTVKLIRQLIRLLRRQYHPEFAQVIGITGARVPIIKAIHRFSRTACDFSFSPARFGQHNSQVVRFLMSCDPRIHPLCMLLKFWCRAHGHLGTGRLSSYSLVQLIVYYLQRLPQPLLPPLEHFQRGAAQLEHGWNVRFNAGDAPPRCTNTASVLQLMLGFFEFYAGFAFAERVICTLTGRDYARVGFNEARHPGWQLYRAACGLDEEPKVEGAAAAAASSQLQPPLNLRLSMCIADPFRLNYNVGTICPSAYRLLCRHLQLQPMFMPAAADVPARDAGYGGRLLQRLFAVRHSELLDRPHSDGWALPAWVPATQLICARKFASTLTAALRASAGRLDRVTPAAVRLAYACCALRLVRWWLEELLGVRLRRQSAEAELGACAELGQREERLGRRREKKKKEGKVVAVATAATAAKGAEQQPQQTAPPPPTTPPKSSRPPRLHAYFGCLQRNLLAIHSPGKATAAAAAATLPQIRAEAQRQLAAAPALANDVYFELQLYTDAEGGSVNVRFAFERATGKCVNPQMREAGQQTGRMMAAVLQWLRECGAQLMAKSWAAVDGGQLGAEWWAETVAEVARAVREVEEAGEEAERVTAAAVGEGEEEDEDDNDDEDDDEEEAEQDEESQESDEGTEDEEAQQCLAQSSADANVEQPEQGADAEESVQKVEAVPTDNDDQAV